MARRRNKLEVRLLLHAEGRGARWPGDQVRSEVLCTAEHATAWSFVLCGFPSSWLALARRIAIPGKRANSPKFERPNLRVVSVHVGLLRAPQPRAREKIRGRKRTGCQRAKEEHFIDIHVSFMSCMFLGSACCKITPDTKCHHESPLTYQSSNHHLLSTSLQ